MNIGKIQPVEITAEMKQAYLDYAMSVIVSRALPDVRDGLKPVHRRILFAMHGMGQSHSSAYTKSAKVVGECFVKNTLVLTEAGLKAIQDIERGELVYTQTGLKRVAELYAMPPKPLLSVSLENGLTNTVTPSQMFKVINPDRKYSWKKAKNLKAGDYLVVKASFPSVSRLAPLERLNKKQPEFLNENLAYLLGLNLAGGRRSPDYGPEKRHELQFSAGQSLAMAKKIIRLFQQEFCYRPRVEANRGIYRLKINQKSIKRFFDQNFKLASGKTAGREIPFQLFLSPSEVIFAFVAGLIDGGGYVSARRNLVRYDSVSAKLIHQLQILLQHQQIFSSRCRLKTAPFKINQEDAAGRPPVHRLEIRGRSCRRLSGKILLAETKKVQRLARIAQSQSGIQERVEAVPFAGQAVFQQLNDAPRAEDGYHRNPQGEKTSCGGLNYSTGARIRYAAGLNERLSRRPRTTDGGLTDKLNEPSFSAAEFLDRLEKHQIYFLKVASVRNKSAQTTYDLQVEDDHEFVANGLVVHNCMGKYHPHGDMAIYDAMVRMAQDFSMRYPLVDGQGNFGSVDGDPPAAMRYTEVRLAKITAEMLADLEKNTVIFDDNFDDSLKEPHYLPAKLPNLLLMGSDGIAVGMATKIPPHNLGEVVDALKLMLKKGEVVLPPEENQKDPSFQIQKIKFEEEGFAADQVELPKTSFSSAVTIEELMEHIKGPDFPTGGEIYDQVEIAQAYLTGKGKITMRAKAEIVEDKKGRFQIVVHEIPYQVNKAALISKIAELHKDKKIRDIAGLRDESDRRGLRIVIELKKTAKPKSILNSLFKYTALQTSYPANVVALVDGTPQTLNLKQILTEFVKHRQDVITRRTFFELAEAKKRAHILEGYKIALDNLDEVISTIRRSQDANTAKANLMKKFGFTEAQALAILELQLRRLAALERKKIEDEYKEIMKRIEHLTTLLEKPAKILKVIDDELAEIKTKYADPRRTKVYKQSLKEFSQADLVPRESCLITVTRTGYIKRLPPAIYRAQRRGGKGVMGMATKEEDEVAQIFSANTHDRVLFFTNHGRVFSVKAWELPEGTRTSRGQAVVNLINLHPEEIVQAIINIKEEQNDGFLFMTTHKGKVKKTAMEDFAKIRTNGLIAIKLARNDQLCWVQPTTGEDQILLVSHEGKSIRFKESDARSMGRDTMGVRGINLRKNDFVVGMEVIPGAENIPKDKRKKYFRDILVIMEKGLGKRTPVKEYPIQKRGGIGVKSANLTVKTGKIVGAKMVLQATDQVILTSRKAQIIKLPLKNIPTMGRDTQGVILMRFSKSSDQVAAMALLEKSPQVSKGGSSN